MNWRCLIWRRGAVAGRRTRRCAVMMAAGWTTGALALAGIGLARAANPDVLWHIVHDQCVPDERAHGQPAPCLAVDLSQGETRGHIVLKDIKGRSQFLLIPTDKITGIESPALLRPDEPNFFAAAWAERGRVAASLGRPLTRDDIGLAVNSVTSRSQNQLHIHIDCLRADVRDALRRHAGQVGPHWRTFPVALAGHRYQAMRVLGDDLRADPFQLLAQSLKDPGRDMGRHTLVVAGADFRSGPGFILLDGQVRLTHADLAEGEQLQDHACLLAAQDRR